MSMELVNKKTVYDINDSVENATIQGSVSFNSSMTDIVINGTISTENGNGYFSYHRQNDNVSKSFNGNQSLMDSAMEAIENIISKLAQENNL